MGRSGRARAGAAVLVGAGLLVANVAMAPAQTKPTDYVGTVEIVRGSGAPGDVVSGVVYDDANRDSGRQPDEDGIAGVAVSNSREVVLTDETGAYQLPAYEGMTVFVTKPAAYDVPVDEFNFPQFFYHHLPEGSPPLRFGGLAPTGPLPEAINFPMAASANPTEFDCAILGDTQT